MSVLRYHRREPQESLKIQGGDKQSSKKQGESRNCCKSRFTVPCNETRLFFISPYELVIFTCLEFTLNAWEKQPFFHDFFRILQKLSERIFATKYQAVSKLPAFNFQKAIKGSFQYRIMKTQNFMICKSKKSKNFEPKNH